MAFSATLTLSDLNDYLAPSQACIRPVEEEDKVDQVEGAKTQIHIDEATGNYFELDAAAAAPTDGVGIHALPGSSGDLPPHKKKLKKAEISLNDCLACSGCITTSQELLLQTHSLAPLLKLLPPSLSPPSTSTPAPAPAPGPPKTVFLSITPQSLASLSSALSPVLPPEVLLFRLQHFLPSIGIGHVSDTTFGRHVALSETLAEFRERRGAGAGPVLNSACPGWVCYAEKAHGEVLANLGRARSPLGVMGALVKGWWARAHGLQPADVYHVSVQPCPDRKLESSRTQFLIPASSSASQAGDGAPDEPATVPETDLVLSTDEFAQLLQQAAFDPHSPSASAASPPAGGWSSDGFPQNLRHPGSSSDGFLHAVLARVARDYRPGSLVLSQTPIRGSADYVEYALAVAPAGPADDAVDVQDEDGSEYLPLPAPGTTVFRSATCYGFKNLQNVVRKTKLALKTASSASASKAGSYDYVEVMACPSGCVNGGGQLKPPALADGAQGAVDQETRWSTKAHLALVESVYQHAPAPEPAAATAPPPLKPTKARVGRLPAVAHQREANALERTVRAEMDAWAAAHAGAAAQSQAERERAWRRTDFQRIDSSESDGGLLGTGVVW